MKKIVFIVFIFFILILINFFIYRVIIKYLRCSNIKVSNGKNDNHSTGLVQNNKNMLSEEKIVKTGSKVWVDYILRLENGKVFDTSIEKVAKENGIYNSSRAYQPLEFVVGAGQVISGFEKAVLGHKVGDKITVKIPPEEGYGKCNPKLITRIDKSIFDNAGITPKIGETYNLGSIGKVIEISGNKVKVDFNSPLCDKVLTFDIFIRKVK